MVLRNRTGSLGTQHPGLDLRIGKPARYPWYSLSMGNRWTRMVEKGIQSLPQVNDCYACSSIALIGGFKALYLGVVLQVVLDSLAQFARAVTVDYPKCPALGLGDRLFQDWFCFRHPHAPQIHCIAGGAQYQGGRAGGRR